MFISSAYCTISFSKSRNLYIDHILGTTEVSKHSGTTWFHTEVLFRCVVACAAIALAFGLAAAFEAGSPRRRERSHSRIRLLRSHTQRVRGDGARDMGASPTDILPRERATPARRRRFAILKSRGRGTDLRDEDGEVRMRVSVRRKVAGKVRAICHMQRAEPVRIS